MSFSNEVKKEVAAHFSPNTGAQLAAMATILTCIGEITLESDGTASLFVNTDNAAALTKFFTLLEKTTNIKFKFASFSGKEQHSGRVLLADHSNEVQKLARILEMAPAHKTSSKDKEAGDKADDVVPWSLLSGENSFRAYLRSLFLCTGMISDPDRAYRCEFLTGSSAMATQLVTLLSEHDIHVRQTCRRGNIVVYTNSADRIGDILTLMDARESFLKFQESHLRREVRGSVNRQVNCETANIHRTVAASSRQLKDIDILEQTGRLESLPQPLQEMARVRRENPEASLKELGELLDPPVGRSGINHRLRSIHEAALAVDDRTDLNDPSVVSSK